MDILDQPVVLDVGMVFRLLGETRMDPTPWNATQYRVLTRDPTHKAGFHLMVQIVGTDVVREVYVWPWTEFEVLPDPSGSHDPV